MMTALRVINDPPANGHLNMAVDESVIEANITNKAIPTLRFYSWKNPCLSIGCNQRITDIDLNSVFENKIDLVRRPTGGRAVLHENELTYSVTLPIAQETGSKISDSCKNIHTSISIAMMKIGLKPYTNEKNHPSRIMDPVCFSSPSYSELLIDGKKIVGSAQMRRLGYLLQHGSIPIKTNVSKLLSLFKVKHSSLDYSALTEGLDIGDEEKIEKLKFFIAGEISGMLKTTFYYGVYTEHEKELASELLLKKYKSDEWTKNRIYNNITGPGIRRQNANF